MDRLFRDSAFVRQSRRAASASPQLKHERSRLIASECCDALSNRGCMANDIGFRAVLQFGMLQLPPWSAHFPSDDPVLRAGSATAWPCAAPSRTSQSLHSPRFVVGLLCELPGVIRVFKRALRMPAFLRVASFFVVFRGRTVGLGRQVVLLGGSQMRLTRGFVVCVIGHPNSRLLLASRRIPMQRFFEFHGGRRNLEVAGQDLAIGRIAGVEFVVSFVIRAKRGAFERDARE